MKNPFLPVICREYQATIISFSQKFTIISVEVETVEKKWKSMEIDVSPVVGEICTKFSN